MISFWYIIIFIFGTLIGSFLNVLVLRYNTGQSIVSDRSRCFSCGKTLRWFELIPILSFIFQGGRCSSCQTKISKQYIFVEILTGLVFSLIFWKSVEGQFTQSISGAIFYAIIFSILIAISVYDYRHKIIPDGLVYTFIFLSLVYAFYIYFVQGSFLNVIAGGVLALPFFAIWFFSGGRWMGFGDVKLTLGIGFLLGLPLGIYALMWAFWVGGFVGMLLLLIDWILRKTVGNNRLSIFGKRLTIKSEIPFGPFLILGTFFVYLIQWDFLHLGIILGG